VLLDAAVVADAAAETDEPGLPVVTTRPDAGIGEHVVGVPPRDPEAMCDALVRLAASAARA
jgi:hypothetical protein